jgi:hypothetical protein
MWDVAVNLGLKAVERFFDRAGKQEANEELNVVSPGLALGYFYNFLDPVSGVIRRDEFSLYLSPMEGESAKFRSEDVRLQIIVPERLDVSSFERCESEFKELQKGFIYLSENKRFYGINYSTTKLATRSELMIVDLARPLMAVKRYYEDIIKLDTDPESSEWMKIQIAERTAFKETLRGLQRRGYGALVNRLDFRERA